jgi:hypothetical protein
MSRSGYGDYDDGDFTAWASICWRGAVNSAIKGRKGQAFLAELVTAMDTMPHKRLIANDLEEKGEVCALGVVGRKRGIDLANLDPEDYKSVAKALNLAPAMVREITYINDEPYSHQTPEARFSRMREWVQSLIEKEQPEAKA